MSFTNAKIIGANVTHAQYSQQTVKRGERGYIMSRGELVEFMSCPAKWIRGGKEDRTREMDWGSLVDCLALTPQLFAERYAVAPEVYPAKDEFKPWNWNATYCKEWRDRQGDREIIKADVHQRAEDAVFALNSDPEIAALFRCSQRQVAVTAVYRESQTGIDIPVRALLDLLPHRAHNEFCRTIVDLKTGASAEPSEWENVVFRYDLHTQAALYLDVVNAIVGEDRVDFRHVVQESGEPYQTGLRILSAEYIELGRLKYQTALEGYAMCLADNWWPGYDEIASERKRLGNWTLTEPKPWMALTAADWPKFPMRVKPTERPTLNALEVTP